MLAYAIDNPAPSTIILITGDRDFAYAMSILRLRQYQVILVTLPNAHSSLTAQASMCIDWYSDVLNQIEQSTTRPSNTPVAGTSRATSSQDKTRSQSMSHQSKQASLHEAQEIDCADQGDLVQYLRAATHYRSMSNTSSVVPPECSRQCSGFPLQYSPPIIEVELGYKRPGPSPPVTEDAVEDPELSLSPKLDVSLYSPSNFQVPVVQGNEDYNDRCAAVTVTKPLPFSTLLLDINESPSGTQTSPEIHAQRILAALEQSVVQEDDTLEVESDASHDEDTPFLYPVRPASAPNSLPSPMPVAVTASYTESSMPEVPSVTFVADPLQEVSSPIHAETPNHEFPPLKSFEEVDKEPIVYPTAALAPTVAHVTSAVPPASVTSSTALPPVAPPAALSPAASATVTESKVTPSTSSSTADPSPPLVVQPIFRILVKALQDHKASSKGRVRALRSDVAMVISKGGLTYKKAGVNKFGQYVALAEKIGLVELGGANGSTWISLAPAWSNARIS